MNDITIPWVLKYFPKTINEMVLTKELSKFPMLPLGLNE